MSKSSNNFLSQYIVKAPLGRGGQSFVYKVECQQTKKNFALKVIDKRDQNFQEKRVKQEIEILTKIDHPNIIKLHKSFEDEINIYMITELALEGDLQIYLQQMGNILEEDQIKKFGLQLARGLKHLHDNNIIHRDLKLANLLLSEKGNILKIADFGLATQIKDPHQQNDTLCGTPNYMCPEIIKRESYGKECDCWQFGCILYALATGKPPFGAKTIKETFQQITKNDINFEGMEKMSESLRELITRTLEKNPQKRFSINEILNHKFFNINPLQNISSKILNQEDFLQEKKQIQEIKINKQTNELKESVYIQKSLVKNFSSNIITKSSIIYNVYSRDTPSSLKFQNQNNESSNIQTANLIKQKLLFQDNFLNSNEKTFKQRQKNKIQNFRNNKFLKLQKEIFEIQTNFIKNLKSKIFSDENENIENVKTLNQLSTIGIIQTTIQIKNGTVTINEQGDLVMTLKQGKLVFIVNKDGSQIQISKNNFNINKKYFLQDLPYKYHKLYEYASQVSEILKSKSPLFKYTNEQGTFILMSDRPNSFESFLNNGVRTFYQLKSQFIKICVGEETEIINLNQDTSNLKEVLTQSINITLKSLSECLQAYSGK